MKVIELHEKDFAYRGTKRMILDLDSVVSFVEKEDPYADGTPKTSWIISLMDGFNHLLTESAYQRVLLAWKSK